MMEYEAKREGVINDFCDLVLEDHTSLQAMNYNQVCPEHILNMVQKMKEKGWTRKDIRDYIWSLSDDELEVLCHPQ